MLQPPHADEVAVTNGCNVRPPYAGVVLCTCSGSRLILSSEKARPQVSDVELLFVCCGFGHGLAP